MADHVDFDEAREEVMELVLSSDEEYAHEGPDGLDADARREDRRVWWRDTLARFLPGVDAGALLALGSALIGMTSATFITVWAENKQLTQELLMSRGQPRTGDVFGQFRDLGHFKEIGQGAFATAAVLIALLVLARWRADRHARWSRPAAQTALLIGIVGVTLAALGYFDVVGGLPTMSDLISPDTGSGG